MLRLLRADHRHRLHGLRSRLLQCHRMSQRPRHWLHTANQSAGSVASWHWATPRHTRLAIPRRILCHTQVNLTECRPSRPCDGERDREHNISAASSGDAGSTFHEPVLRRFALSSPPPVPTMTVIVMGGWCVLRVVCQVFISSWGRLAVFDGSCAKCLFKNRWMNKLFDA